MDWIYGPIHEALYMLERLIASIAWGLNQSLLYVVELIERFRLVLVTAGFRPAIQTVADQVLGISRSTLELGLVLGLLFMILQPVIVTRFVNLRRVVQLMLLLPLLLPVAGTIFQEVEQARSDLGQAFFERIFNGATFDLLPADEERTGANRDMGPLVAYSPNSTALHGIDVAAAYLYAVRADVVAPTSPPPADLPDAFAARYFPYSPEELGALTASERWEAIDVAGQGIIRMGYGGLLVLFALSESVVNLLFTLGLGLLLTGLLLSLVFAWAAPVEHISSTLIRKICELILTSWGLSAIQGLVVAAIIDVATTGNAVATLGMGSLGLLLEGGFALVAAKTIAGALIGVANAGSAGGISEQHVQRGAQAIGGTALAAASGGASALLGAGGAVVGGALKTGAAGYLAKRQGASTGYALGYALSHSNTFARAGALAQAMGAASPDSQVIQGLYTGNVIGRGEIGSLRTQRAVRRDIDQQHKQRQEADEHDQQEQQALGTAAVIGLWQQRHAARQQAAADTQETRFVAQVQRNQLRHQAPPAQTVDAPTPAPPPSSAIQPPQLLAPIPHLMQPTDRSRAIAAATAALGAQIPTPQTARPTSPPPVDGPGYLAAVQAHHAAEQEQQRPFWEARPERVSAAGSPTAASAPAQEPIPPQVVVEHITQQATAPGTVITPDLYPRTVTPEPADTRIATATAALHMQYQAQRTTTDTPPSATRSTTRPRRRGPTLTTQKKEHR